MTRRDGAFALGVFVASLPWLAYGLGFGVDLDVAVAGGDRVLRGEWPYRDFWTLYAPGSSAAVGAIFALFGRELLAVHAAAAVAAAASTAAFFALLRAAGLARTGALAACAVFALAVWEPSPPLDSYALPRVLLLLGWERVLRGLRGGGERPLLAAGLAFGAAALFKHDVAAYAAFGSALALVLARTPSPGRGLVRLAAGCACVAAPGLLAVAAIGGLEVWRELVVFPAREFAVVRGEPYPGWLPPLSAVRSLAGLWGEPRDLQVGYRATAAIAEWGQAILPPLIWLTWALHAGLRRRVEPGGWLAGACLPFFWAAAHVQQNTHLFTMGMLSSVLVAELWPRERSPALRAVFATLTLGLAASFALSTGLGLARMQLEQRAARELGLPGTRGIRVAARDHAVLVPIARLLRERVSPGEPIHVALGRHDAIVISDPRFYYLADRPAATRYHELHPGVADRAGAQQEIIEALEARGVRAVVVWNFGWPDARLDDILAERRRWLPGLGARRLDAYLRAHYERIARYGEYEVLWRRDARGSSAPSDGSSRPVADRFAEAPGAQQQRDER